MSRRPTVGAVAAALLLVLLAACSGGGTKKLTTATSTTSTSTTSTSTTTTVLATTTSVAPATTAPSTTARVAPSAVGSGGAGAGDAPGATAPPPSGNPNPYAASAAPVGAEDLGASWHPGCPVEPSDLRMVTVTFVGFDGGEHVGRLVVNADVVDAVIEAFRIMHEASFPIHDVKPIVTQAEYDDFETPATTGFSCRDAVNDSGTSSWSQHAFGHAIDVNPVENPYVHGGTVSPAAGAAYTDRSDVRPGMAVRGSAVNRAFQAVGWGWGAGFGDYQHFSTTGT